MSRPFVPTLFLLIALATGACAGHRLRAPSAPVPPPAELAVSAVPVAETPSVPEPVAAAAPAPARPEFTLAVSFRADDVQLQIDRYVARLLAAHDAWMREAGLRIHSGPPYVPHPDNDALVAAMTVDSERFVALERAYVRDLSDAVASVPSAAPVPKARRRPIPKPQPQVAVRVKASVPQAAQVIPPAAPAAPSVAAIAAVPVPPPAVQAPSDPPRVAVAVHRPSSVDVSRVVRTEPSDAPASHTSRPQRTGGMYFDGVRDAALVVILLVALLATFAYRSHLRRQPPRPYVDPPSDGTDVLARLVGGVAVSPHVVVPKGSPLDPAAPPPASAGPPPDPPPEPSDEDMNALFSAAAVAQFPAREPPPERSDGIPEAVPTIVSGPDSGRRLITSSECPFIGGECSSDRPPDSPDPPMLPASTVVTDLKGR